MVATYNVLGKPIGRYEGPDKVTGAAKYTADVILPGTLIGKTLQVALRPRPHRQHRHVRGEGAARRARRDHRRRRAVGGLWGRDVKDVPVHRLRDSVRFIGERVAAVAADDEDIAQQRPRPDRGGVRGAARRLRRATRRWQPTRRSCTPTSTATAASARSRRRPRNIYFTTHCRARRRRRRLRRGRLRRREHLRARSACTRATWSRRPCCRHRRRRRVHVWLCSKVPVQHARVARPRRCGSAEDEILLPPHLHRRRLRRQGQLRATRRSPTTWRRPPAGPCAWSPTTSRSSWRRQPAPPHDHASSRPA